MPLYMFAYVAVLFYCSLSGAAKHRFTIESICVLAHFSDSSQQKILQFISLVYGSFSGGSLEQAKVYQQIVNHITQCIFQYLNITFLLCNK